MATLIGIDVGGTNLRLGVVKYNDAFIEETQQAQPQLIEEKRFQTDFSTLCKSHEPKQAWQSILNAIAAAVESMQLKHPEISAVGIGFPGFIDPKTQAISQSPNLPGLSNVDLSNDLSQIIELPVITENDALAAAYGEYISRATQINSLIYLGLGTGVGGGLILNGQPFQGQHGVAMEVGHITVLPNGRLCGCGNHGCMEQYASASGIAISYFETNNQYLKAHEIADLARQGDQNAIAAYHLAGKTLAQALAHLLKVIDVTDVVIGGGVSAGWALMELVFAQQLDEDLIPALRGKVNVTISQLGDQAGIIGAAMLASQKLQ
ncbi:MAG: ROK family protein [Methylotenera sp.]|uniref:ROK family protein n=1 Tax=Methylotenera sp. TaxID=2051956 RepID=UPI0017B78B50|nr:ROK family protein [Methylotenera sp.]NOU25967.1 ROK family protein [Methylotenera sp.]